MTLIDGTDSTSRLIAQYGYDQQNQLTCETRYTYVGSSLSGSYTSFEYFYDTAGNLLCVKENGVVIESYAYGNSSWSDLLTSYNGHNIAYEGQTLSGNTVSGTAVSGNPVTWYNGSENDYYELTWTHGRRLSYLEVFGPSTQTRISYTYDMDGVRTEKNVEGEIHKYVTQNGKVVREKVYNGSTLQYTLDFIYDAGGQPFALIRTLPDDTKATYYYILNAQGDVVKLINAYGTTYATYSYDAWGRVLSATGSLAEINPLRYRGYYYDTETGWYYLQSRYYDPILKRFINADSFASTGQGFLGYNMFAYCNNAPVGCMDQSGNSLTSNLMVADSGGYNSWPDYSDPATTATGLVNGQGLDKYKDIPFAGSTIGNSGCGAIAVHNALRLLGFTSTLRGVMDYFESSLRTRFTGVWPLEIRCFLTSNRIAYNTCNDLSQLEEYIINGGGAIILTFTNEASIFTAGAHTVAISYSSSCGLFYIYNAYNDRARALSVSHIEDYIREGRVLCGIYITPQERKYN